MACQWNIFSFPQVPLEIIFSKFENLSMRGKLLYVAGHIAAANDIQIVLIRRK